VSGNLDAPSGERLGFELTFSALPCSPSRRSRPRRLPRGAHARIYMAHFAITDVSAGRFRFAQKLFAARRWGSPAGRPYRCACGLTTGHSRLRARAPRRRSRGACAPRSPAMSSSSTLQPWHHRF